MAEKSTSPWIWVGCGCAGIVGIGLVLVGAAALIGLQTAKTMSDPEARQDKALDILSAGAIPTEYETELALSLPFFADIVVLDGDDSQFVYLKGLRTRADLGAAFADDDSFDAELRRAGLKIGRRQKVLARDAISVGVAEVRYMLVEGDIDFDVSGRTGRANFDFDDDHIDGELSAVVLLRCSPEDRPGLGLWAGPRADKNADPEDPAADQAALVDFVEQFGFCSG